jgi:hypothetical protein
VRKSSLILTAPLLTVALACACCDAHPQSAPAPAPVEPRVLTIGPDGGRVPGPNGAEAVLPPGALAENTRVELVLPPVGTTPPLPPNIATVGATYALGPSDLHLSQSATVSIPFDPAQVPAQSAVRLYAASSTDGVWHQVAAAYASDGRINATIASAASFVVVVAVEPVRP